VKTKIDVKDLMLSHIRRLEPYQGVRSMDAMVQQAGIPAEKVIRLNGNENPYGPSPRAVEALGKFHNYNYYPDPDQRRLREVLSDYVGLPPEQIVAGNGSDEIIDLLMRMFLGPGENIIIPSPTFGMYAVSAGINAGEAIAVERDENFEIDVEAMRRAITPKTKGFFIPSPNNPTGNVATEAQIRGLLDTGLLVAMDEAYYEFCGSTFLPLLQEYSNLVVIRTFSKWAGLAGLRIGLGVMQPDLAQIMFSVKPPYNVTLAAEVALLASLEDRPNLLERVHRIVTERDRMMTLLNNIKGLKAWPSQANFILIQLPTGRGEEIYEKLCNRGIFLRYFNSERLKDHIRTTVGLPHETDAVVDALGELVAV
jgi:histidinol-phosphate aminotransferase